VIRVGGVAHAVHLVAAVAVGTGQPRLAQVHIARNALVQPVILVLDAAAVAGGAGLAHGRLGDKGVPFEQAAAHRVRLGDVAVAACRVTLVAVVALHELERVVVFGDAAFIERGVVAAQRGVQAVAGIGRDVRMAGAASRLGIGGRIGDQALVSRHAAHRLAAMTGRAGQ